MSLLREALGYLISTYWLMQEAAEEGSPISRTETSRLLAGRERSEGHAEFATTLALTDRTSSDLELEIGRELALARITAHQLRHPAPVSEVEEAEFYRKHRGQFVHAERRDFYLVEYLKSAVEARKLIREITEGRRALEAPGTSLQESLERPRNLGRARTIVKAIFTAKPGVVTGPVTVERRFYFIVKVARVRAPTSRSLTDVRSQIERSIEHRLERRSLRSFAAAWRRKWIAQTRCQADVIVPGCREFTGAEAPPGSRIF